MQAELNELFNNPAPGEDPIFDRKKPEGWVRIPLDGGGMGYYRVPQGQVWINKHEWRPDSPYIKDFKSSKAKTARM